MKNYILNLSILFALVIAGNSEAKNTYEPMSQIDFWRHHFQVLTSDDAPLVAKAEDIFHRVLKVAGHRYGTQPQLLVVDTGKRSIQLPVAIPGGWIILSKQMLDKLAADSITMDNRLAFILGHEIAHQLEDDFWNIKFFNAVQSFGKEEKNLPKAIEDVGRITRDSNKVIAKELKADEQGIIYAAIAGYNVSQLFLQNESNDDFFKGWISNLYPQTERYANKAQNYPSLQERETAIKARLHQVHSHAKLFQFGVWFYYSGQFDKAAEAFREFVGYFPEKSAHLNLAASYHQLSIQHQKPVDAKQPFPFRLSFDIDPYSNARFNIFRSAKPAEQQYQYYRDLAIQYYELALSQDSQYIAALNNLACLYIMDKKPYKAISYLLDALQIENSNPQLHNNIAIAFYYSENVQKARLHLERSLQLDAQLANGYLNSGLLEIRTNNKEQATQFWDQYLKLDNLDDWATALIQRYKLKSKLKSKQESKLDNKDSAQQSANTEKESINNIVVGTYLDELPSEWHSRESKSVLMGETEHRLIDYSNGVSAVCEDDELRLLIATSQFTGGSRLKIRIGDSIESVRMKYGTPNHLLSAVQGEALMYVNEGITFITANDQVTSWVLYWD